MSDKKANPEKVYVPICSYNDELEVVVTEYNESYCNSKSFQSTFNEYGMCFTFNNRKQGIDDFFFSNSGTDSLEGIDNLSALPGNEHDVAELEKRKYVANNVLKVQCYKTNVESVIKTNFFIICSLVCVFVYIYL